MITFICILVDALCFCVQYRWFIEGQADHTNVWMMFVTIGFLIYDSLHIFYLLSLKKTLPAELYSWCWEALFGDLKNLKAQIKNQLAYEQEVKFDAKVEENIQVWKDE